MRLMRKTPQTNGKTNLFRKQTALQTTQFRSRPFPTTREKTLRGEDAKAAYRAAEALHYLLRDGRLTGLPPEPVAHAVLGALRRHPEDGLVQYFGCFALCRLCEKFSALRGALRRDPSVLATVRAAAKVRPNLEKNNDWYTKQLCVWLQPPCLVWRARVL